MDDRVKLNDGHSTERGCARQNAYTVYLTRETISNSGTKGVIFKTGEVHGSFHISVLLYGPFVRL